MKIATIVRLTIGLALTAAGLYIFLHNVDLSKLLSSLRAMHLLPLAGSCVFVICILYLRTVRWRIMLPDIPGSTKKNLFEIVTIGFFLNNILPARMGEIGRAFILWKRNGYSGYVSIGSLIVERLLDLILFLAFFIIPVFTLPPCAPLRDFGVITAAIIVAILIGFAFVLNINRFSCRRFQWIIVKIPEKVRGKLHKIIQELLSTLAWVYSWKKNCAVIVLSVLIGLCYCSMLMLLSPGYSLGILETMFAQAFAVFGAMIPFAPGFVGTLHAVMLKGFLILGVEIEEARALIIVYHAINYIVITVLGLIFVFRMDLSFKEIMHASKKQIEEGATQK